EVLCIAAVEPQPDPLPHGHDLAQATGVRDDAWTAGGHRLERDQAAPLIDGGNHAEIGDPIERVQRVVAYPAEEGPVGGEPQPLGLRAQLALVGAAAGDDEAHVPDLADHVGESVE